MPRTTLTISTESRNYTVQGGVREIDALFDRLVAETFKPMSKDEMHMGIDYAEGPDYSVEGDTVTPNPQYERLRGRSACPDQIIVHNFAAKKPEEVEVIIPLSPAVKEAVDTTTSAEKVNKPSEDVAWHKDPTPVQDPTPHAHTEPRKWKSFLMIECEHCGKVKGFNSKQEIDTFRCDCGQHTPLGDLVPMTAMCECGKHWRYFTNMTRDNYELNCINCGSPIPVFWNDKKGKYETLIEALPREHKKKGGKK